MEVFYLTALGAWIIVVIITTAYLKDRLHKLEELVTKNFSYLSNCIRILSLEQNRLECRIRMIEKAMNNNRNQKRK